MTVPMNLIERATQKSMQFYRNIISPYSGPISPVEELPDPIPQLKRPIDLGVFSRQVLPTLTLRALRSAIRAFLHAYGARVGLLLLLRLLSAIPRRRAGKRGQSVLAVLAETLMRRDPVVFGAFVATFTGIFKLAYPLLQSVNPSEDTTQDLGAKNDEVVSIDIEAGRQPATIEGNKHANRISRFNAFLAGCLAGCAILFEPKDRRKMFAQQLAVRAGQAVYNGLKVRNLFHFPYGDSLIFTLGTAQVLYAYAMHPKTIPKEFYGFMVKSALIPDLVLRQVASCNNGGPINVEAIKSWLLKKFPNARVSVEFAQTQLKPDTKVIGCEILHPQSAFCTHYLPYLFQNVFRQIIAVYIPLNLVPLVLFRSKYLIRDPASSLSKALLGAVRSSVFFATLVTVYQAQVCSHRALFRLPKPFALTRDFKYLYFIFGVASGATILMESKGRRSELAMYVLPKAVESVYRIMVKRNWMFRVPGFEQGMFMAAMGVIMSFYATETDALSPLVNRVLRHFIGPV